MTTDQIGSGPRPGGMFRRILVGYDGSTEAQHALRVAHCPGR